MSVICKEVTCEHCGKKSCDCHSFYDTLGIEEPGDINFKEEARQKRIKMCGKFLSHWRPELKKLVWYQSRCKERDCPDCQKFREGEMLVRLGGLVDTTRVVILPNDTSARQMIEDLGLEKPQYLRIPELNQVTLVLDTLEEVGEILTEDLVEKIAPLVNTPKGRKISGSLGKLSPIPKKEKTNIPQDEIKVREFHIDFTNSNLTYKDIQDYVLERTRLMNPQTKYELQTCMDKLEEVTEVAVSELLGNCERIHFLTEKTLRVCMDEVHWQRLPQGPITSDKTVIPF